MPSTTALHTCYHWGYRLRTFPLPMPRDLAYTAAQLGAVVVDVRYGPNTGNMVWHEGPKSWLRLPALTEEGKPRLKGLRETVADFRPKANYIHVSDLGNVNFGNGGPIRIDNLERGLALLLRLLRDEPCILLCACEKLAECHRYQITQALSRAGVKCQPLDIKYAPIADGEGMALSIYQPHASLVAGAVLADGRAVPGPKHLETRGQYFGYKGPIIIHSSARSTVEKSYGKSYLGEYLEDELIGGLLYELGIRGVDDYPCGRALAIANMVGCFQVSGHNDPQLDRFRHTDELQLGDFSPNRYCLEFEDVTPLPVPVPLRGNQGLWPVDVEDIRRQGNRSRSGSAPAGAEPQYPVYAGALSSQGIGE